MNTTKLREIGEIRALLKMDQVSFGELLGMDARTLTKAEGNPPAKLSDRAQEKLGRLVHVMEHLNGIISPEDIPLWLTQEHPGFDPDLSRAELLFNTELFEAFLLSLPQDALTQTARL